MLFIRMAQFPTPYSASLSPAPSIPPVVELPPNLTGIISPISESDPSGGPMMTPSTGNRSSLTDPSCANQPESQPLIPGRAATCPSAHALHSTDPTVSEKKPGEHSVQGVKISESPSNFPAGQASQSPTPAQNEPGAQQELDADSTPLKQALGCTKPSRHVASH